MSNLYNEAADAIRRAAKQYEIFVTAAEALEKSGSFVQAADEAKKAADAARKDAAAAQKDLDAAKAALTAERDNFAAMQAEATAKAQAILSDATAQAKAEAADIVGKAQSRADAIVAESQTKHAQAMQANKAMQLEATLLSAQISTAKDELAVLKQEYDRVQSAIDALKAKFK